MEPVKDIVNRIINESEIIGEDCQYLKVDTSDLYELERAVNGKWETVYNYMDIKNLITELEKFRREHNKYADEMDTELRKIIRNLEGNKDEAIKEMREDMNFIREEN